MDENIVYNIEDPTIFYKEYDKSKNTSSPILNKYEKTRVIYENFKLNKKMIEEKINSNISKKCMISVPLYHISENINYEELYKVFKKFDLIIV